MIKDIPKIGLGTWEIRGKNNVYPVVKAAIKTGYTHIDTANIYRNEKAIGDALKRINADKSKLFITSKVMNLDYQGNAPKKAVNRSLKRLGVDQIDLMLLHTPFSKDKNIVNAYKKLMEAREEGKVRLIGVSNFSVKNLELIKEATGEYPYVNQIVAAPTVRRVEVEEFCKEKGIKLTAYSTLRAYFNPNTFYPESGMNDEQKEYVNKLAKKHKRDIGQILSRWAIQNGYTVIPKSIKPDRVKTNFKVEGFQLTKEEMKKLNSWNSLEDDQIMQNFEKAITSPAIMIYKIMWKLFLK